MGMRPCLILYARLAPADDAPKLLGAIAAHQGDEVADGEVEVSIGDVDFTATLSSGDVEDLGLASAVGEVIVYATITYGYGKSRRWIDLSRIQEALWGWLRETADRTNCAGTIYVVAGFR